jgi:hypothetical protein
VPPAVDNFLDQVQTETARLGFIEARFPDVQTGCDCRLLHGDRDGMFAGLDGDADGVDAFTQPAMANGVGDDLRQGEVDVVRPLTELQHAELGDPSSRYGGGSRTRDDLDLVLREGLVLHRYPS